MNAPAPRLRLFVALDLPPAARAELARFRDAAVDAAVWRALDAASFHVTLAFLGHRPQEQVGRIAGVLGALERRPAPQLLLGDALQLPPGRARVLAVALDDPSGALAELQAQVVSGLAAAGLHQPEARAFRPHVTVARLRAGASASPLSVPAPQPLAFTGGPVTLYRSLTGRGGAVYEALFARSG